MSYTKLGNSDLEVSEICFGAWAIGGWLWGGTDEAAALRALDAAIDSGVTSIDTAAVYGNEDAVGRAIKESGLKREEIFVTTKVMINDFGANARRIRNFFRKVKTGLEEGEKRALEIALARRAKEEWKARKKKEKIELAKRKAQRAKEDEERRKELRRQAQAALRLQQEQAQAQRPQAQQPFLQQRRVERRRSRGQGFWSLFGR